MLVCAGFSKYKNKLKNKKAKTIKMKIYLMTERPFEETAIGDDLTKELAAELTALVADAATDVTAATGAFTDDLKKEDVRVVGSDDLPVSDLADEPVSDLADEPVSDFGDEDVNFFNEEKNPSDVGFGEDKEKEL